MAFPEVGTSVFIVTLRRAAARGAATPRGPTASLLNLLHQLSPFKLCSSYNPRYYSFMRARASIATYEIVFFSRLYRRLFRVVSIFAGGGDVNMVRGLKVRPNLFEAPFRKTFQLWSFIQLNKG